jgi:hypothetical protein
LTIEIECPNSGSGPSDPLPQTLGSRLQSRCYKSTTKARSSGGELARDSITLIHTSGDPGDSPAAPLTPKMKQLPKTANPLVIRTDFENQQAWEAICDLIRAPIHEGSESFYAYVEFLADSDYRNLTKEELLAIVPPNYDHAFLFVVDRATIADPDFAILAVQLIEPRGRSFRAIPSQIQSIENNLSIANMDFEEFEEAVDKDGIFRGFPRA